MKPTMIAIAAAVTTMLFISCGDNSHESGHSDVDAYSSHSVPTTPSDGVRLNNGHKWKMDDHTRSSFAKMADSFLKTDYFSMEGEGLKKAGADLQDNINELIKGCTMTGDAHDQLHMYLTGYIAAVASLSESGRIEDAEKIRGYLEKYVEYFE